MAGFGVFELNLLVQEDVFEKISSYVFICCEEMKIDLDKNNCKLPNDENKIRNILSNNYLDDTYIRRKHNMTMFHFIPEALENYNINTLSYEGRVDIKVVNQNDWFENGDASYFIECKRLDGNKRLNNEYVINGIKRFVSKPPHYSTFYNKNYMLGFQVKSIDTENNAKKIELLQQANTDIDNLCGFIKSSKIYFAYSCKYNVGGKTIELKHMFVDLAEYVSK